MVVVENKDLTTNLIDYSVPQKSRPTIKKVNYQELRSGSIYIAGKKIKAAPMSSLKRAREIAEQLKDWIVTKHFYLQEPIVHSPMENTVKGLEIREEKK